MNETKYYIKDNKLYHESGYQIPEDEPLMIFRGKDVGALVAITAYIDMLREQPINETIDSHLNSSMERLKTFLKYQYRNDIKTVTCSHSDHILVKHMMLKAESTLNNN
jgi:hypothetical protein